MNRKQYEAKRKQLLDEAQALIDEGKTEEAEAKMQEVGALDEKWDAIAQAQANLNALNSDPKPRNPFGTEGDAMNLGASKTSENPKEDAWASETYKNAWAKKLMNLGLTDEEEKAYRLVNEAYTHTTGNTSIVIPKTVTNGIWEEAGELYPYFGDVSKTYVNGVLSMIMDDTSSDAAWYDEATKTEDGKETFKQFSLDGCELSRAITVSWKLKEMAIEDFIPYIQRKMAKKMGAALGYGSTHGAGKVEGQKPEPTGVVTALEKEADTPQIVEYSGTEPTYKDITTARGKVKSGYAAGLRIYANSRTIWTQLANIVDANKRPIFIADPTTGGFRVLGMQVKEDDSMKDGEILMSNPGMGYTMNINKEMTVLPEDHIKDRETDYCGYAIVDGNALTTKAHALLKKKVTE